MLDIDIVTIDQVLILYHDYQTARYQYISLIIKYAIAGVRHKQGINRLSTCYILFTFSLLIFCLSKQIKHSTAFKKYIESAEKISEELGTEKL